MKTPFYYSDSVDRAREFIRLRDRHSCQECGQEWTPGTRKLDVHHLDEAMYGKSNNQGIHKYDLANPTKLVTLCHKCHMAHHKGQPLTFNRDILQKPVPSYQQVATLTPPSPLVDYIKVDVSYLLRNNKFMKQEPKRPVSIWLRPSDLKKLDRHARKHKSRSEFISTLIANL